MIMDFSGVYCEEQFWKDEEIFWVDARDIPGTNCYCDGEAMEELKKRIADFSPEGIHFIDSGNYHYMSRIWLEKIKNPFRLLVFDNHTDMQLPAFGGLLSCGGWIAAAITELDNLKEVILVGPDEEAWEQVETELRSRVRFISREVLREMREGGAVNARQDKFASDFWGDFPAELPLYISIDKDVLGKADANTAWSQGDMTLQELLGILEQAKEQLEEKGGEIIGVDICGECDPGEDGGVNDDGNGRLLGFFCKEKGEIYEK